MKFEEILPYLKDGKKCRLKSWNPNEYIVADSDYLIGEDDENVCITVSHLHSDEWELYNEGLYALVSNKYKLEYFLSSKKYMCLEDAIKDIDGSKYTILCLIDKGAI